MTVRKAVWNQIESNDHRLMRRVNRWRAPLWRALAYSEQNRWADAREGFQGSTVAIATLPIGEFCDAVAFDPANSRIFVQFTDSTSAVRGATSVAVETQ